MSFYVQTYKVTVGELEFKSFSRLGIHTLEINKSLDKLTTTCVIKIGRSMELQQNPLENYLKVGDAVRVEMGYDWTHTTEFVGYLTRIKTSSPLELFCEDAAWQLKQKKVKFSAVSASLADVLNLLNLSAGDFSTDLGKVRLDCNGAEVLQTLKDPPPKGYGLRSFFRMENGESKFKIGRLYDSSVVTEFALTGRDSIVDQNNLEFSAENDVKLCVKAIYNKADGKKETTIIGDKDGATRTLNYTTPNYKELAEMELKRLRFTGYRGTFRAIGLHPVQPGHAVRLVDSKYPERAGTYYAEEVTQTCGVDGSRILIKLGAKARAN